MFNPVFADVLTSAQGAWLITGLGAIGFLVGIAVGIKKLFFDKGQKINPQPLIVAMEKEFVLKHDHEDDKISLRQEMKDVRAYAHQEVHNLKEVVHAVTLDAKLRSELLSAVDERTKIQSRSLDNLSLKMDRQADRVADKVEALLRKDRETR